MTLRLRRSSSAFRPLLAVHLERLDARLDAGYAWINLHAAGVVDGRLLVGVEFAHATRTFAGATSVNLSGPTQAVTERDGWPIELQRGER